MDQARKLETASEVHVHDVVHGMLRKHLLQVFCLSSFGDNTAGVQMIVDNFEPQTSCLLNPSKLTE